MPKFADLHLAYGYPLQVEVEDEVDARYVSRLIGCLPGKTIVISGLFSLGKEQNAAIGAKLTVRFMTGRGVCHFSTSIVGIHRDPLQMLYLAYPDQTHIKIIRNAERVEAQLPVVVNVINRPAAVSEGVIRDISSTGVCLELEQPIAEIGEGIALTGDFPVETMYQSLRTTGIVRNRMNKSDKKSKTTSYGIEFTEKRDEKKIILFAYVNGLLAKNFLPHV